MFAEYSPSDETVAIQCLNPSGELETLKSDGGIGSLSPNGDYVAFTKTRSYTSLFDYDMSLYIYEPKTDRTWLLREGDGHIAVHWMTTNDLIIFTWHDRITNYAFFTPDHRFLYNPRSEKMVELNWPIRTIMVGYWPEENSYLLADDAGRLIQITRDGTPVPIPLPVQAEYSNFTMSPDGRFVAYKIPCRNKYVSWACLAVYELGSDHIKTITAFAETHEVSGYLQFSATGRYLAVMLDYRQVGIYDLARNEIPLELSKVSVDEFVWARDQDLLFLAAGDESDKEGHLDYLYLVNPETGEMSRLMPQSIRLLGFYK